MSSLLLRNLRTILTCDDGDAVLEHADLTVRIGYSDRHGFRGSLPSAASAAVLAFEVMRQNR